jgi:hypothetical protein
MRCVARGPAHRAILLARLRVDACVRARVCVLWCRMHAHAPRSCERVPLTMLVPLCPPTVCRVQEISLEVEMSGVGSTQSMLHAAFDACAETVGMELEANESKQISLRYVTREGKEKRLNTKVPWEELLTARAILIKLQQVGAPRR